MVVDANADREKDHPPQAEEEEEMTLAEERCQEKECSTSYRNRR